MVLHVCESCNYSTNKGWIYRNHLISNKHLNLQTSTQEYSHVCEYCTKKYKTTSGLWKHKNICKNKPTPQVNILLERITQLENKVLENQTNNTVNNITHNITNNIIINQLDYLNTHCGNAMNIDQFIDSMKLVKDDFNEIDKNRYYYQGATKILKKYFAKLSLEERPMHRATPVTNRPDLYFVRDENSWKQECQSMINYQIKYIEEFENEDEQLAMTRFFEKFNDKLYDTYKELSTSDKKMERIHDKMAVSGYSQSRIDMLDELTTRNLLALDPPSATNTNTDLNLLAT